MVKPVFGCIMVCFRGLDSNNVDRVKSRGDLGRLTEFYMTEIETKGP